MNAVIYARYSCDNQREESIEGQLRECQEFARKSNLNIVSKYIDRAYSAKTDNRPEFQRMIRESSSGLFSSVIVWKLDRFARNRYDSAYYKTELKKHGVKVISATETISNGAEGIILESVLEGYAEYYSAELSEKVIRGMKENALQCKYNGGNVPIGFFIDANKHYQINSETAPLVREAFAMYASNFTLREIAEYLSSSGIRTHTGKKISINCLYTMFQNRKYIGEYKYKDFIIPNGIPAIIPQEIFETVYSKITHKHRNSKTQNRCKYLLSSKLKCGKCHSNMNGESGTSKTGTIYNYYKCASTKRHSGCHVKGIRQEVIEKEVLERVVKTVLTKENIKAISNCIKVLNTKENAPVLLLKKQHRCVVKSIDNFLDAISQGCYTDSIKERLVSLENQKASLEKQIEDESEKYSRLTLTQEQISYWISNILVFLPDDKKSILIDTFVDEIYYFEEEE